MTRKKLISFVGALFCVAAVIAMFYSPRPVIKTPYSMAYDIERWTDADGVGRLEFKAEDDNAFVVNRIRYYEEDVTESFDPEAVAELFSGCMSRRAYVGSMTGRAQWEIDLYVRHDPVHICLGASVDAGASDFWYEAAGKVRYKILDPKALTNALEKLMEGK